MAFIPAVNTAKITVTQMYLLEPVINVYWVKKASAFVTADLSALAATFATAYNDQLLPFVVPEYSVLKVSAQDWTTFNGESQEFVFETPVAGGMSGDAMPGQNTALISWLTGLRGRSYRGRTYISGLSESYVSGDAIAGALHTALGVFAAQLRASASSNGCTLSVASFETNHSPRSTAAVTPIVGYIVRYKVRTQRRRASSLTA